MYLKDSNLVHYCNFTNIEYLYGLYRYSTILTVFYQVFLSLLLKTDTT